MLTGVSLVKCVAISRKKRYITASIRKKGRTTLKMNAKVKNLLLLLLTYVAYSSVHPQSTMFFHWKEQDNSSTNCLHTKLSMDLDANLARSEDMLAFSVKFSTYHNIPLYNISLEPLDYRMFRNSLAWTVFQETLHSRWELVDIKPKVVDVTVDYLDDACKNFIPLFFKYFEANFGLQYAQERYMYFMQ